ncbi:oligosaccharide flippase family protein [Enterococcus faecalis]|nr:oligosaccharide flippase family protein [Enterococcus faecalis]
MNKYKKLLNNSLIFAVGNLGSKMLVILLVPLYTRYLTPGEYGTVDLVMTTTNMLTPIISFNIHDAVLRYILDKKYANDKVLSNGLIITLIGMFFSVFLLFLPIEYSNYLSIIIVLQSFQSLFSNYARGIGRVKLFTMNGLLYTLFASAFTVLFLVFLNMGLSGYFLAIIIATFLSTFFLFVMMRLDKIVRIKNIDWYILKRMLLYSIPLIPNSFAWWLSNASSRYFILFFLGVSTNGLFAIANKVPALLTMLNTIFFQSWQLSAVEEYNSNENSAFYTNVFFNYTQMIFSVNAVILTILKLLMFHFVTREFFSSWLYIPPLLVAGIYASFSSFLGTTYIAAKQTKGVLITTIIGFILNVLLNIICVPVLGGIGAGVASLLSFLVIWLIRQKDSQKFISIKINKKNMILNHTLLLIQILLLYQTEGTMLPVGQGICLALICIINRRFIKNMFFLLPSKVNNLGSKD